MTQQTQRRGTRQTRPWDVAEAGRRLYHKAVPVSRLIAILLAASSGPVWMADAFPASAIPIGTGVCRVYSVPRAASFAIDAIDATTRRTVSSRALDGNELIKIGDLHEVQNHLQEALPYYQRALTAFRGKKDQTGEATALVRIAIVMERQDKH